tara:strand:- start:715 stop:1017 length:303 start_codon:yes stop_codon:yes gene_type:complete
MELVEFIGVVAIVLLFTKHFQPIQPIKNKVVEWLIGKIVWLGMKWTPLLNLTQIVKLLTCPKCLSFWILLYLTHSLFIAATGAIVAMVVDNMLVKTQIND